jgi:pimeloyl-ACP methyl ester carboxylesterase
MADVKATTLEVLGRKIHELRGGSGAPLLYLHSAASEAVPFPFYADLANSFEVHAPAHPGFLESQGIEQIRTVEDYVYHYLAYLDQMGWQRARIVGLSLGGWIAAELAARYPERVEKLVLVGSVGIWIREKPLADIFAIDPRHPERMPEMLFYDTNSPIAKMFMPPNADVPLPDEVVVNFINAMAATAKVGWNPLLHDPSLEALLPRVTADTLCLWGSHDRISPPEYGEKFAKLIPGARLEIVPRCGHMVPLEKPAEFVRAVTGFVQG